MNSGLLTPPTEIEWVHLSRTPAYSIEIAEANYLSRSRRDFAWKGRLVLPRTPLHQWTRTPFHGEPQPDLYEQNLWIAIALVTIAAVADFLQGRILPADPIQEGSTVGHDNADWWERPGIGPAGIDLVARGPAAVHSPGKPSSALLMADDLRSWLNVTYEDLAGMTGVGKTTFHHWKRTGAEPRPATIYRLRSVHALVRALIAKMGVADANAWLRTGMPSPLVLLIKGNLRRVENLAQDVLFNRTGPLERNFSGFAPYDPETDVEVRSLAVPSESTESASPRRIRLPRL